MQVGIDSFATAFTNDATSLAGNSSYADGRILPREEEYLITMTPSLVVSGTVRDSTSGQPVSGFRLVTGYPEKRDGEIVPIWDTGERQSLVFEGGDFSHAYDDSDGRSHGEYILKFEAAGYEGFISRTLAREEGAVHLDVTLKRAPVRWVTERKNGEQFLVQISITRNGGLFQGEGKHGKIYNNRIRSYQSKAGSKNQPRPGECVRGHCSDRSCRNMPLHWPEPCHRPSFCSARGEPRAEPARRKSRRQTFGFPPTHPRASSDGVSTTANHWH